MRTHRLETFTDRDEERALFDNLRSRDPNKLQPLLPILAFIAPGGSGKSTLIQHLIELCSVDGKPAVPYAHLRFVPGDPTDLLTILGLLRNQLQDCADGQGKHLTFPRFNLGELIARATTEDLSAFTPEKVRCRLSAGNQVFESLTAVGSTLGFVVPYLPALLAGVKLVGQFPAVQNTVRRILGHLEDSTYWKWYRMQSTKFELRLGATASMEDVLLRLYELSRRGKPEREELVINELLPAAFAADLYGALIESPTPKAWSGTANVVIFLGGFEAVQRASSTTATDLLRGLTTEPHKHGHTDPLLLVIGSCDPLTGMTEDQQPVPFARTVDEDKATAKQRMHDLYVEWLQRPKPLQCLRPEKDLVLPIRLRDFGPEHTRSYLREVDERRQKAAFEADDLVQAIDQVTHGQPLFLALAAEAVLEAEARQQPLQPTAFELLQAPVPPERGAQEIGEYLLDLFLRQLPDAESKDLVFCAVPRVLDEAVFRVVLPSLDDIDAPDRWKELRQRSFMSAVSKQRSMMHPVVRALLLRRLTVSAAPKSTFVKIHTQLKDYFTQRATTGEDGARIEAAYHALTLGDPEPAIRLGMVAQRSFLPSWDNLVEAVREAPTELLPSHIREQAIAALFRAQYQHGVEDAVTAIVLYTWLLSAPRRGAPEDGADLQRKLGDAYLSLPVANPRKAIGYYEATLQGYTREDSLWKRIQNNLGQVYSQLPSGDREANLRKAIAYYEAASHAVSSIHIDDYFQMVTGNLERAKSELRKLNQPQQLTPPQQTQPGQEIS